MYQHLKHEKRGTGFEVMRRWNAHQFMSDNNEPHSPTPVDNLVVPTLRLRSSLRFSLEHLTLLRLLLSSLDGLHTTLLLSYKLSPLLLFSLFRQGQKRLSHGAKQQLRKCQNWREGIIETVVATWRGPFVDRISFRVSDAPRLLSNPSRSGEWGPR